MVNEQLIDTSSMTPRQKKQLLSLLQRKDEIKKYGGHLEKIFPDEGPLAYYNYPRHMEFFKSGAIYNERLMLCGNRVGKTTAAAYEISCHVTGIYPHWWEGYRFDRPIEVWVAGSTRETTRDAPQKELLGPVGELGTGMIPRKLIQKVEPWHGVSGSAGSVWVKHEPTGGISRIGFKTYDQKRRSFEGTAKHICVTPDVEILTQRGWTTNPAKGDKVLSYYNGRYVWANVNFIYRKEYEGTLYKLKSRNNFEIRVTPEHKWLVFNKKTKKIYLTHTKDLKTSEQLIVCAGQVEDNKEVYDDNFVALVGWVATDGTISKKNQVSIYQSESYNASKCDSIRELLSHYGTYSEHKHFYESGINKKGQMCRFAVLGSLRKKIVEVFGPDKELSTDFINQLSSRQRKIFLDAVIAADGMYNPSGSWSITATRKHHIDLFQYVATLLGYRTLVVNNGAGSYRLRGKTSSNKRYNYNRVSVDSLEIAKVAYKGEVYCPNTDYGTCVFRAQERAPVLSGQCWFDEEPPNDIYNEALLRTMTTKGLMISTLTPMQGLTDFIVHFQDTATSFTEELPDAPEE